MRARGPEDELAEYEDDHPAVPAPAQERLDEEGRALHVAHLQMPPRARDSILREAMMRPEIELCHDCMAPATYRASTRTAYLYKCPKGHTTAISKLVGDPPRPRSRTTDVETSHAAAASVVDVAGVQRVRILQELEGGNLTADELDERISWRVTTAGRRLSELLEMGAVRRLEATRKTRSGRLARLWELADV